MPDVMVPETVLVTAFRHAVVLRDHDAAEKAAEAIQEAATAYRHRMSYEGLVLAEAALAAALLDEQRAFERVTSPEFWTIYIPDGAWESALDVVRTVRREVAIERGVGA